MNRAYQCDFLIVNIFSVLGCIGSICHLLSLSVGHAQTTGSETGNSCCDCLVNLCLDVVTAIQLDPKFIHNISNQITCPDDTGTAMYVH